MDRTLKSLETFGLDYVSFVYVLQKTIPSDMTVENIQLPILLCNACIKQNKKS